MSVVTTISTHVLDTSLGMPAAGVSVTLDRIGSDGATTRISSGVTNDDGRVTALAPNQGRLAGGSYRLSFDVASYFAQTLRKGFYSEICIAFEIADDPQHYHVPLLLSPFGYSTYRGS
jgi:5-hydroxyisourate hydrolase